MGLKCDAVFEGGGVRGIGHVGAAYTLERAGYEFENLVGSSAGAIVAALLAAGYTAAEIKEEMESMDYSKFKQDSFLSKCGTIGKLISICLDYGVYNADYFEAWLSALLLKKGKLVFGDIKQNNRSEKYQYKLQVTASDVTDQRLLILPRDLPGFGFDPDTYSIAKAVRMSMSIPIFYKPFHLTDNKGMEHFIVDGGLLSNYPIWLLDKESGEPSYPTFGFKFTEHTGHEDAGQTLYPVPRPNIIEYLKLIVQTALDAADKQHISNKKGDYERTIAIPVTMDIDGKQKKICSTDFSITELESRLLFHNGMRAAENFLSNWNFPSWKTSFR